MLHSMAFPPVLLSLLAEPLPLAQLEQDGAELARFLGVNLEGL